MYKNYFIVAVRNLLRNKAFSFINIVGLALGISCSLLILLWVQHELSVDQFHENGDRIYRILEKQKYSDGSIFVFNSTPGPMAPVIKEKYPEIELAARITWEENHLFSANNKANSFYQAGRFADEDFLKMFLFPLEKGDKNTALKDPYSIVVSAKMAKLFFADEEAIGKTLVMDDQHSFTVTGVFYPLPNSSSLQFDFVIPFSYYYSVNESWLKQWDNNNIRTNIKLAQGADVNVLADKLKNEIHLHTEGSRNIELFLQKFNEAYLHGKFENGVLVGGRIDNIKIFIGIAFLVLLIAGINFTNLAIAQATKRAKEVGLRKSIGAIKSQLATQFLLESFLMVVASACVAILLVLLLLPFFNVITEKSLSFSFTHYNNWFLVLSVVCITALISGSYPAFYVSSFQPQEVLKGQLKSGSNAVFFRKSLVIIQFVFSIVLIISTIIVYQQMQFINNKDIGFKKEEVLYARLKGDMNQHREVIRETLLKNADIEWVGFASVNPINFGNSTSNVKWDGKDPNTQILFSNFSIDPDFISTLGIKLVSGRSFEKERFADTLNFIINETAAIAMGFEDAVDQPLTIWDERKGRIIGVVKDFHFQSVHNKVEPLFMLYNPTNYSNIFVRFKKGKQATAIALLENVWKKYATAYPFEYTFLHDDWDNLYKNDKNTGTLFNYFACLSIVISSLGLFGLSAYAAQQRVKEIGVRKVLGAQTIQLVVSMCKEFVMLVLLAILVGCPIGYWMMSNWLSSYAYHIEISIWILFLAAGLSMIVSVLTVSYHAFQAARADPAHSLRYE